MKLLHALGAPGAVWTREILKLGPLATLSKGGNAGVCAVWHPNLSDQSMHRKNTPAFHEVRCGKDGDLDGGWGEGRTTIIWAGGVRLYKKIHMKPAFISSIA